MPPPPTSQRLRAILALALPITGGMLSQSLLNLVDTAMVGSLGDTALAGVGVGGYATFMAMALIMGLSSGVQATVARRRGEGRDRETAVPLNGGLLLAVTFALPLMLFFLFFSEQVIALINQDPAVGEIATPYFEYRVWAMLAVGLNFSFRGYWNGINRSMVYLRTLVLMHLANVVLSYGLIFGELGLPELGAVGAGLGTTLALYFGSLIYALLTWRQARPAGYLRGRPDRETLSRMLKLSIPNSLQQFLFATSVTALLWIIGQIGTREVAVTHVLINLALLLILPGVGLGMAATTLVSHALGAQRPDAACAWGWDVVKVCIVILALLSLPMWLAPDLVLGLFLHDPELIDLARTPLRITGVAICVDAAAIVFTQALLGAGANRTVMLVTTSSQWLFYLPLAWIIGPLAGWGLTGIWIVQVIHRALSSVVFSYIWAQKKWTGIRI